MLATDQLLALLQQILHDLVTQKTVKELDDCVLRINYYPA